MKTRVTATEAARKFSEILNRVAYKGESFIVERGGRPVCEITPAPKGKRFTGADFLELIRTAPRPDDQYFKDVEDIIRGRQSAMAGVSTRELVEILSSGPRPDKGYFRALEKITREQPSLAPTRRERPAKKRTRPRR